MSWYGNQLSGTRRYPYYSSYGLITMSLRITSPLTEKDREILTGEVSKLPGIKATSLDLASKKMNVAFDTGQIRLEDIAYKVARLGYQYAHRA